LVLALGWLLRSSRLPAECPPSQRPAAWPADASPLPRQGHEAPASFGRPNLNRPEASAARLAPAARVPSFLPAPPRSRCSAASCSRFDLLGGVNGFIAAARIAPVTNSDGGSKCSTPIADHLVFAALVATTPMSPLDLLGEVVWNMRHGLSPPVLRCLP